jgi:hypothetical protein
VGWSAVIPKRVWATEVACVAVDIHDGGGFCWATTKDSSATGNVEHAVERAYKRLLGGYGLCDIMSIDTSPVIMGNSDRVWLFVTVLAELRTKNLE